ncbi:hypothetical protein Ddye_014641 [Dipteronia dyeriana]|uniref:Reverse transcriptase domain-containing protein n=1 Tax=Dipteronia dyeriana TaxID=168575 RepID=A0AAD9X8M9_9ROSI|nr:hypothetical protein Ddye_014641 [Dipteronia dyeriana]
MEGDKNTPFFHCAANGRRRRNLITELSIDWILSLILYASEVRFLVSLSSILKGRRGEDLECLGKRSVVKEINKAFIALIPKVGKPESMKDYKPNCLVSACYKLLSKVLANRLRKVMDSIIGETQMAFVSKRQILDYFVIVEKIINKWKDICLEGRPLKESFPRCFVFAVNLLGVVQDFGNCVEENWVWKIDMRRPSFNWEKDEWRCLLAILECIPFRRNLPDVIAWSLSLNGVFSIGSFRKGMEESPNILASVPKFICKGIFPSKIEIFVWQLWKGKVSQAADLVKYRIVWWFKNLGKGSNESIDSLLRNIKDICVDSFKVKKLKIVDWIPPFIDNLKFNVDGSSEGKSWPSGIGGALRDSNGKALFSQLVLAGLSALFCACFGWSCGVCLF